jgi:hypothetical protein
MFDYFGRCYCGFALDDDTGHLRVDQAGLLVPVEPIFAIALWNNYERVKRRLLRSNNGVEGWHSAMQVFV